MTVVQPRARIVRAKSEFQFDEKTNSGKLRVKTRRTGRLVFAWVLSIPLILVAFFGLAMGSVSSPDSGWLTRAGILSTIALVLLWIWATRRRTIAIIVDATSITVGRKSYLLEHVTDIGWMSSGGYAAAGSGVQGASMMAAGAIGHAISGTVYIVYGADTITLIKGLHPSQTEIVYSRFRRLLEHFGHSFN